VMAACERAIERGVALRLEGFPWCAVPGYERFQIDWEDNKFKMLYRSFVMDDYEGHMDDFTRVKDERCDRCVFTDVCGGVYKEYAEFIGWDEFQPVTEAPAGDAIAVP